MFRGLRQQPNLDSVPAEQLAMLLEVGAGLAHSLELDTVLQTAIESACRVTKLDTGAIYLLNSGDVLHLRATWPALPPGFPNTLRDAPMGEHPHIGAAIKGSQLSFFDDIHSEPLSPAEQAVVIQRGLTSLLYVPFSGPAVNGILLVGSTGRVHHMSDSGISLCSALSSMVGLAVNNAYLYESLGESKAELEAAYRDTMATKERLRALALDMTLAEERQRRNLAEELTERIVAPLETIERQLAKPEAADGPGVVSPAALVHATMTEAREITAELRPMPVGEKVRGGIDALCDRVRARGMACEIYADAAVDVIGDDIALFVFQAARELLDNAAEHSDARTVTVSVSIEDSLLVIRVTDDGRGFPTEKLYERHTGLGFGLFSLRERTEHLGGTFAVVSALGTGTNVSVGVPVEARA